MINKVGDGKILNLLNGSGSDKSAGDVIVQGNLTGIATVDIDNGDYGACEMEGIFDLSVTDSATGGISIGDPIRVTLSTGALSNASLNAGTVNFFGYALEAVADGATATINVLKVMCKQ